MPRRSRAARLRPRALRPGQWIGVCATSGPVRDSAALEAGIAWLETQGHRVRRAPHLGARRGYLAGEDGERMGDLLELLGDPDVGAVIAARGGYGSARFLARLDARAVRRARKPLVGYSDATSLLLWLDGCARLCAIHGPMLERADLPAAARERVLALLRGDPAGQTALQGSGLRAGRARGRLVGGNLRTVAASLGTPWEIDTRGAILFLEEVGEQPYSLDRSLVQLREAGKLRAAAGVAFGALVGCESERYPETSARAVLCEILAGAVDGPIALDLPFGHIADHRALGFGALAELDGGRGALELLEPVVEAGGNA
jgi:muramoyltetrapeptide carboxypeptidase